MNLEFKEILINYVKVKPMVDDDVSGIIELGVNIKTQIIFVLVPFFFFLKNLNPKMIITFMFYVKSSI
jgi:hypothetical protein